MKQPYYTIRSMKRVDREPSPYAMLCSCHFVDGKRSNLPTIFSSNNNIFKSRTSEERKQRFPTDNSRREEWLRRLGFQDNIVLRKHSFVCSLHFNPEDFEFRPSGAKVLKKNAIPILYVPGTMQLLNVNIISDSDSTGDSPTGDQGVTQIQSSATETEKESSASDYYYLIPIMRIEAPMPSTSHDLVETICERDHTFVIDSPPPILREG